MHMRLISLYIQAIPEQTQDKIARRFEESGTLPIINSYLTTARIKVRARLIMWISSLLVSGGD